MTVDAINAAIAELSEEDASSLAIWLMEKGYGQWHREMVADFSPGGCGIKLFEQVQREITPNAHSRLIGDCPRNFRRMRVSAMQGS
jgi:hypothetical protein